MTQGIDQGGIVAQGANPTKPPAIQWPIRPIPKRRLIPLLRDLIASVQDELLQDEDATEWAACVARLGRLVDRHRGECLAKSVTHNLGARKVKALEEFIATWDAIGTHVMIWEGVVR